MSQVWDRWGMVLAITALCIPAAAALAWVLTLARRRGGASPALARRNSIAETCVVAGTLPWLWMILTPLDAPRTLRLVPLIDLLELFRDDVFVITVQLVGNLLVFAAAGFFLPIRFRIGPGAVAALAAIASATVEAIQYTANLGRVSSVDDVLINTLGAAIAAGLSRLLVRPQKPDTPTTPAAL